MAENIEHYRNQVTIARTEIKNLRLQLTALKHEHQKQIQLIKSTLEGLQCSNCGDLATPQNDHVENQASTSENSNGMSYQPIGIIETSFQNKRAVPRQPSVLSAAKGTVVINQNAFTNPEHALSGLEEFSHMWIIFHFHATESTNVPAKVAPPRLGGERRGVFATRSPHRPCPIGLSLVKIQSIQGNKIHFQGVDMVNGTPVLDIKPYIPQYDCPSLAFGNTTLTDLIRPPTEGNSDGTEISNLQIDNEDIEITSPSPRLTNPIGIDTNTLGDRTFEDTITSSDNQQSNLTTPISPSPDSPSSIDLLDDRFRSPIRRPETERGAPDGQERFTPPQTANMTNISHDGVRIAPWIMNPPSQTYAVTFTDDALTRLNELIGERAQMFKSNIECLLAEDPRSHYVRTRYPDHEYSCVLEDLSICCVFDASTSVCTIIAVRNAEELQQT